MPFSSSCRHDPSPSQQGDLDGIQVHVVVVDVPEAVPVIFRIQLPALDAVSMSSGCHTSKNQPSLCSRRRLISLRKEMARSMESLISRLPVLPRIMAAEISVEATMPYCGEVEVLHHEGLLKVSSSTSP